MECLVRRGEQRTEDLGQGVWGLQQEPWGRWGRWQGVIRAGGCSAVALSISTMEKSAGTSDATRICYHLTVLAQRSCKDGLCDAAVAHPQRVSPPGASIMTLASNTCQYPMRSETITGLCHRGWTASACWNWTRC
jgi:hypothetical protein